MSFLVPEEQWSTVAVGSVHADYYSSFLNYTSHKFRGIRLGNFSQNGWEGEFHNAIMAHPPGQLPASVLSAAFEQFDLLRGEKRHMFMSLSQLMSQVIDAPISQAERELAAWLFPGQSAKKSKGARNKAAKKRKATVKTAVAAARYYDDNSPQLIIEGLGSALPEINQNDNDDEEDEGEDDDDDDDGGVPVPVSFSSLAYRPA